MSNLIKCGKSGVGTFKDTALELLENEYYDTSLSSQLSFIKTVKFINGTMHKYNIRCKIDYYKTLYNVARFIPTWFISKYRMDITKVIVGVCNNGNGGIQSEVYTNNGTVVSGKFELSCQLFPIQQEDDKVRYECLFILNYQSITPIFEEPFVTGFTVYPEDTYNDILDKFDGEFRKLDGYLNTLTKNKEEVVSNETIREAENVSE